MISPHFYILDFVFKNFVYTYFYKIIRAYTKLYVNFYEIKK